jgi:hypothetical protein
MVLALTMRPEIYLYLNTIANERTEGNAAMRLYGRMRATVAGFKINVVHFYAGALLFENQSILMGS